MRGVGMSMVALALLASCLQPRASDCGDGVCPPGQRCVLDNLRSTTTCGGIVDPSGCHVCAPATCGNGTIDPDEACDDGNNISGDGCPSDCGNACGDGVVDPGEACDDGNHVSRDGCAADCKSNETCTNGIVDANEVCDDGNLQDGDGCSTTCALEQPTRTIVGTAPSPRADHAMTYDPIRGTVVALGGAAVSDTWEWDGTTWMERSRPPAAAPAPRVDAAITYDLARHEIVLFGGCATDASGTCVTALADTWTWDGAWVELHPAHAPPARFAHAITYDGAHERSVLFGGCTQVGATCAGTNDTWEWDGVDWHVRVIATPPPVRSAHALAFDSVRGVVVMFGGATGATALADTWELGAAGWQQRVTTTAPPARSRHAMAYDAVTGHVVVSSGCASAGTGSCLAPLQDLWEWNGASWSERTASFAPSARSSHGLAFDSSRNRLVLFGGRDRDGSAMADTWEWDHRVWRAVAAVSVPAARREHAIAFDPTIGETVMFGGVDYNETSEAETWLWDGSRWAPPRSAGGPPAREGLAAAFAGASVLMFGGHGTSDLDDTWSRQGTSWIELAPAHRPSPRAHHAMAYDATRGKLVLFGGCQQAQNVCDGGYLGDTWEWDGSDWTPKTPASAPTARAWHAMAFDAGRGKVVLFGGGQDPSSNGTPFADTWEWDGTTWTALAPAASPPARQGHAMAYDSMHGRIVLFGGCLSSFDYWCYSPASDTWVWDGSSWSERRPTFQPAARALHAMTYDSQRGVIVMSAGIGRIPLDDTWEWDGSAWLERNGDHVPPGLAAIAYDSMRGRSVVFGVRGFGDAGETWEWDGASWVLRRPSTSPPARRFHGLAYDSARREVVMFGGISFAGDPNAPTLDDTWVWNGNDWQERIPATRPPPTQQYAMAYDAARGNVVMFGGGRDGDGPTWVWDGTTWSRRTPAVSPPDRIAAAMAYDPNRRVIVMFGGDTGTLDNDDTWEWDGANWQRRVSVTTPPGRARAGMVYDPARKTVVMFGGEGGGGDAWEWDGMDWTKLATMPSPAAREAPMMVNHAATATTLMFGGFVSEQVPEVWLFRFGDEPPAAVCRTGFAHGGAEVVGCTSPDCASACAACGDGVCDPVESCRLCPGDCGRCSECGDSHCDSSESCVTCPGDCGECL